MIKDGKTYHAKYAEDGGFIGRYIGNVDAWSGEPSGFPLYRFGSGTCHSFDADSRFADVPGQEWVEEFFR